MKRGSRYNGPVRGPSFLLSAAITFATGACILDLDNLSGACVSATCDGGREDGATPKTDGGGDALAPSGDAATPCPSLHGPTPVRVVTRAGAFCIDATEVTVAQYGEFLQAKGADTSGQPTECSTNTTFAPLTPGAPPTSAIGGVDWCDALAFCTWSGKTLCGGFDGAAIEPSKANDPTVSTWFAACSNDGKQPYPYGAVVDLARCNSSERTTSPIAASTTCAGGYAGIFDLSGNVEEWTASCESPNPKAGCLARGGNYSTTSDAELGCSTSTQRLEIRDSAEPWRGIRCCSR